jgi:hypothetical protein
MTTRINEWYEGISADLLGSEGNTDALLEKFAPLYENELTKLLPNAKIEVSLLNTLNGHNISVYDHEELVDEIEYQDIREKAWDTALEKL